MHARILLIASFILSSFVLSSTALSQTQIQRHEEAYFAHPSLVSLQLDREDNNVVTTSIVTWPFRIHNTETTRMKLDGTKVVTKKKIARQNFHEYGHGTHLMYYTGYDLEGKELTYEQLKKRIADGVIGIHFGYEPQEIPDIYRSVFKERTFHWSFKPWDEHKLFNKEAIDKYRKHIFKTDGHAGIKSPDDEGFFHCPSFMKNMSVSTGRLNGTRVFWKGVVDEPKMFQTVVGPMLDFPFPTVDINLHKANRSLRFDRLECRTPNGKLIETSKAIEMLNAEDAVAIYLGKGQKLHPAWAKALKETVVVISKNPGRNDRTPNQ